MGDPSSEALRDANGDSSNRDWAFALVTGGNARRIFPDTAFSSN